MGRSIYEAIRILLVSAQSGVRDEVASILQAQLPHHQLHWVSHPDLALGRVDDLLPHLILVDDELPGISLASFVKELGPRARGAAILALVDPSVLPQISQVMLAGAQGFLPKPLDQEQLVNALHGLLQAHAPAQAQTTEPARPAGRVIAFCAAKGGTGCTTLAANTALALSQQTSQPTALVDANYAAPAVDVILNLRDGHTIADLLPRLSRMDEELVRGMLARHSSGIYALQALPGSLTPSIPRTQVHQVVDILRRSFAWVLVDVGVPLDETAWAWLDVADRLVLSAVPETVSLHTTRQMLAQLSERGYRQDRVRLVIHQATLVNGVKIQDIEDYLPLPITETISADQALSTRAMNNGVPAILSHDHSALARDYRRFARQIVGELPCKESGRRRADSPCPQIATWPSDSPEKEPVVAWQIKPRNPVYGLPIAPAPESADS